MGKSEVRESIGLVLVFLGLVFVGMEMRQNTRMMQGQIRNAITETTVESMGWVATSESLAEAGVAAGEGTEALSRVQLMHLIGWFDASFRTWENEHYQNKIGLFTEDEFLARRESWRYGLERVSYRELLWGYWGEIRMTFAPDFRADLDAMIAEVQEAE